MSTPASQTLWSETLLEMLSFALRTGKADRQVREIVHELRGKGYRGRFLVARVERELGSVEAFRLRSFL